MKGDRESYFLHISLTDENKLSLLKDIVFDYSEICDDNVGDIEGSNIIRRIVWIRRLIRKKVSGFYILCRRLRDRV